MTEDRSSPRSSALSVPVAVLLGAVIIGAFLSVAVYLALRPGPAGPQPSAASPVAAPSAVTPPVAAMTTAGAATVNVPPPAGFTELPPANGAPPAIGVVAAPTAAASKAAAEQQISAQLDAARAQLVKECWAPSVAAKPSPAQAKYVINATFGADGAQIVRGLVADRGNERPDVDACLSQKLPMLQIAATGQTTYLEVPFTLP